MKRLVGLTILTMLILSVSVMGQDGAQTLSEVSYSYFGSGARAMAMGNAFIGLSDDVTGSSWNPAGIWVIERPLMSASYMFYIPRREFSDVLTEGNTLTKMDEKGFAHFSFAAPFRISGHPWVFCFNFNRDNDNISRADYFSGTDTVHFSSDNPDVFLKDESYLHTYSFGFSTRIYKQLSMGITADVYQAKRAYEYSYLAAEDVLVQSLPPVYKHYVVNVVKTDSTTSKGFGFTLGLLYKLNKSFSAGAVVRAPFKMKNNSDLMTWYNVTANGLYDATNSYSNLINDSIAKQDMPLSVTVGFAFKPEENTYFTMDVNYQNYSSSKWYRTDSTYYRINGDREDFYSSYSLEWKDAIGVGFGVEHSLVTKYGRIPLRAGFRVDKVPKPNKYSIVYTPILDSEGQPTDVYGISSYEATGQQTSYGISFGSGIHWSQIGLDFAYSYTSGAETKTYVNIENYSFQMNSDKIKSHDVRVTFTGYF